MADINRFMVPAEIPQPSFFQLPYEQMKQGLLVAQQQQDQARAGLDAIGNIQFNYLTNPEDVKAANDAYGYIDKGIEGIVAKQGNGDLRGLRNDIGTHAKNVSKLFRPDQIIGRLQSNYAAFNDWYKKQLDNKDLDPIYVTQAAETFMNAYDKKGGARAGSISTENLVPFFDSSKFVNDNKDMIKSTLIQRERDRLGNNGYKYTDEQLLKQIPPERVKQTLTEILISNPHYNSSLAQRVRLGNLGEESIPLLLEPRDSGLKDIDGKPIMISDLNPYNPSASAIHGAMAGLGVVEEDRQRYSIGTDESFWKRKEQENKMKDEQMIPGVYNETITPTQETINNLQTNFDGSPLSTQQLYNATSSYRQVVEKHILNPDGTVKTNFKKYFEGVKDLNGKIIETKDILNAYTMAMHNPKYNLGNGIWIDEAVQRKALESLKDDQGKPKYKINWTLKDGFGKKILSLFTGAAGAETDIPTLNNLGQDIIKDDRDPVYKEMNKMFDDLRAVEVTTKEERPSSVEIRTWTPSTETKNGVFKQMQNLESLGTIAQSFNFTDREGKTGVLSDYLADNNFDKNVGISVSTDMNGSGTDPQRIIASFRVLDKKGKPTGEFKQVELFSKNAAVQNSIAGAFSEGLARQEKYIQEQPSYNQTGVNARINNVNFIRQTGVDQNINNYTKYDEGAKTAIQTKVGGVVKSPVGTFKKKDANTIYFISGPLLGQEVKFHDEAELKEKFYNLIDK